jgi:hypothetical protein
VLPGRRALLEFAHPAFGIIGLAFWLGFTLVHNRVLGWIGFGLVVATICAGLTWFTVNTRAAHRPNHPNHPNHPTRPNQPANHDQPNGHDHPSRHDQAAPAPSFNGRLIAIHGGAATVTFALAALSALILRG